MTGSKVFVYIVRRTTMGKSKRRVQKNGRERANPGDGWGHWDTWNGGKAGISKSRKDIRDRENRKSRQARDWGD